MSHHPGTPQGSQQGGRSGRALARARRAAAVVSTMAVAFWYAAPAYAVTISPAQPPGTDKIQTILNYGGWTVTTICAFGFLACAGTMAIQHRRGEGGEHVGKLGIVMG